MYMLISVVDLTNVTLQVETAASLAPHLKQRTLQESSIGTWTNVITVRSE